MSVGPIGELAYRGWDAEGRDDLRAIRDDLAPNPDSPASFPDLALAPQQKGWVFERWLMEAFRPSGAVAEHRYPHPMADAGTALEEIDGLVFDGWQAFLIETKYERRKMDIDPIFRLHLMTEQRMVGTIGLFFSMSGYTQPALEASERLRPIRVLLFAATDIRSGIRAGGGMMEMVRDKWTWTVRSGRPNRRD